jgi:predicted nucleotidyltransferase component of viral defense system
MKSQDIYWEVLDKKQKSILPKLSFLKKFGFYLAGGTALALQIKHRRSVDFDFYNPAEFNSEKILFIFQKENKRVTLIQRSKDTLIVKLNNVEASLFWYPYRLLKKLKETEYINLASIEDISCMKLIAIIQRGTKRDFVDLYFLIQCLGLEKIFKLTAKKYPSFNKYLGLQAITYFADAEKELTGREINSFKKVTWQDIKKFLINQAKEYKKQLGK